MLYILILLILYKLCEQLFNNREIALTVVILYGLSYMGLSTFLMIRMYILRTLFTVLLEYIVLQTVRTDKKYLFPILTLTMFAGLFTQYYFVFYAFFICVGADIYFLINKNYKKATVFSVFALLEVALMYVVYPICINHLFANKLVSGRTAVNNIFNLSQYGARLIRFIGGICVGLTVSTAVGAAAFMLVLKKTKGTIKNYIKTNESIWAAIIILPAYISLVAAAIVSPYNVMRYVYNLRPIITLIAGYMLYLLKKTYIQNTQKRTAAVKKYFVFGLIVLSVICMIKVPGYLYRDDKAYNEKMRRYSSSPCICICENNNPFMTQNLMQLLGFEIVYVTNNTQSEKMKEYVDSFNGAENVVFW